MGKIVKTIAIAVAMYYTGGLIGGWAAGLGGNLAKFGAQLATALKVMAVMNVLNAVVQQLAGNKTAPRVGTTGEYQGTVEPRRIVYGQLRLGGMDTLPMVTSGTNNGMLHQVLTIAGHEVTSMTDVYFNNDTISSGLIGSITGASTDGLVSSGTYANKVWLRRYTGTSTQAADYILDSQLSIWTADHHGYGIAYLAAQFSYDEKVWKTGKPELSVLVQGKKIYDPRKDGTNGGTGSHRLATPSTWEYSTNPALCLVDYIKDTTLGMGEDYARIDWPSVTIAADHCDETVACPDGVGGSTTQKRYTCNVNIYATTAYEDNIGILAGAMLGSCVYSGGKWRIRAGTWESSSFTLGDADIIAAEFTTAYPYKERYNGIRGAFVDPLNNYQLNEFPATQNATYVTADGESVFKDLRLDACTNVYEAQRTAVLIVRKSRNGQSATLKCSMSAWKIRPGEIGIITHSELGWSNQYVRCEAWKFNPEGTVEVVVREENSADWNDPVVGDYTTPLAISNVTPVYFSPDAPSALTAFGNEKGITFTWTAPTVMPANATFALYEHTSNSPFSSSTKIWEGNSSSVFISKSDVTTRYYWIAVRMLSDAAPISTAVYPSGTGIGGTSSGLLLSGYLTVPAATLAAASDGTVSSFTPADGVFKMMAGSTDISTGAGVTYAKTAQNGCTATINSSTGAYSVSAMSADSATATFTGTYGSVVITCVMVLSKSKAGTNGGAGAPAIEIQMTRVAFNCLTYADGSLPSGAFTNAFGFVSVYSNGVDVTAGATLSSSASSCTGSVNTALNTPTGSQPKGYYFVSAMSADNASLTITIVYNSVTYTKIFALSRSKAGYEVVGTLPSTELFEGRMVFLTSDGKLYRYHSSAWTKETDGADISATSLDATKFASGVEPITVVASVPGTLSTKTIFNTGDGKLYRWNGSSYVASVAGGDITATSISAGQFVSTIKPVEVVTSLPTAGTSGRMAFLTSNGKLYRDNGYAWVPADSLNLIDSSRWILGSSGAQTGFTENVFTGATNGITLLPAPDGVTRAVWRATASNTSNAGGGWVTSSFPIDPTKTYRFSCWMRPGGTMADGQMYLGCVTVKDIPAGTTNTNPYFVVINRADAALVANRWYLFVGYIMPSSYTGAQLSNSGVWDGVTGEKVFGGNDVKHDSASTTQQHRAFQYYASSTSVQDFFDPRVEICDGTEGTLHDLLSLTSISGVNKISSANYSKYINAGAIHADRLVATSITASQIASDTITAGQIAAGAITANELLVTPPGSALNPDPGCKDSAAWIGWSDPCATVTAITDGRAGNSVLRASTSTRSIGAKILPCDPGKTYRISAWVRSNSSNGVFYLRVIEYGPTETSSAHPNGTERTSIAAEAQAPTYATWTWYSGTFSPSSGKTGFVPQVLLAWGASSGSMDAQDVRIEEVLPATLIKDGAITTDKMTANSISGDRIAANSLDAGKIVAATISATQIAAGAITTAKLLVTGNGKAINNDPTFLDQSAWTTIAGTATVTVESTAPVGSNVMRCSAGGTEFRSAKLDAIEYGKRYKVSCWARKTSGTGYSYLRLYQYNSAGTYLTYGPLTQMSGSGDWENFTVPGTWTKYTGYVTISNTSATQAGVYAIGNYSGSGVTDFADLRFEEYIGGEMIVDGTIGAAKLIAHSITADQISGGTITAAEMSTDSITAIKIKAGEITASKFLTDNGVNLAAVVPGSLNTTLTAYNGTATVVTGFTSYGGGSPHTVTTTGIACTGQIVALTTSFLWKSANDGSDPSAYLRVSFEYSIDNGSNWLGFPSNEVLGYGGDNTASTTYASFTYPHNVAFVNLPTSGTFKARALIYNNIDASYYPSSVSRLNVDEFYINAFVIFTK